MRMVCKVCNNNFFTIPSRIKIGKGKYCSKKCYYTSKRGKATWNKGVCGYKQPNISKALIGRKWTLEARIKRSELNRKIGRFVGEDNPSWKGGITSINMALRNSVDYKKWRKAVFERDNYTCQWCKNRGGMKLHADHIKQFAYFPELRFELSNGRTLCKKCHIKTDTYKKKVGKFIYA